MASESAGFSLTTVPSSRSGSFVCGMPEESRSGITGAAALGGRWRVRHLGQLARDFRPRPAPERPGEREGEHHDHRECEQDARGEARCHGSSVTVGVRVSGCWTMDDYFGGTTCRSRDRSKVSISLARHGTITRLDRIESGPAIGLTYRPSRASCTLGPFPPRTPMAHDLVIRNGTLVDGTGAAPRAGDVAVQDGRIAAVGHGLGRRRARRSTRAGSP